MVKKRERETLLDRFFSPSFKTKLISMENLTYTETQKQQFLVAPPLNTRKQKDPGDCYSSFIDQIQGGDYSSSKLVRNTPRKTSDSYFLIKTRKTSVGSYRRNYSHKSVALYRTKKEGSTRKNIAFLSCSFLELDGANDNKIKTQGDVLALISKNSLPQASYVIGTSRGNFHLIWDYSRPLPWTTKGESYWISQQKRLIQLFEQGGFLVDRGASMNPTQNLRNPSQLNAYNYKRGCEVFIHSSYSKTSLRRIYRSLNKAGIPNPRPMKASVKLRRYERANKTFTATHKELAIDLNLSPRTIKREIKKAVQNGDLRIVARLGNNSEKTRTTQYESLIFIEQFPEVPLVSIKDNSVQTEALLRDFKLAGAKRGWRQKTIFALGLYLKARLGKRASIEAIRGELLQGAMACHVQEKEFERTLRNIMKSAYSNPLSVARMREWNLIEGRNISTKYQI